MRKFLSFPCQIVELIDDAPVAVDLDKAPGFIAQAIERGYELRGVCKRTGLPTFKRLYGPFVAGGVIRYEAPGAHKPAAAVLPYDFHTGDVAPLADLLKGPGKWRKDATGETSREAALKVDAKTQRARALAVLIEAGQPMTPEQITDRINMAPKSAPYHGKPVMLMSIRPRCSELMRLGLIEDSGLRARGAGGCNAIAWRPVKASPLIVTTAQTGDLF